MGYSNASKSTQKPDKQQPLFGTERKILLLVITSIFSTALFTVFVFHHYLSSDLNYRILSRSDAIFSLLLSRIPAQSVTDINTPDDSHEILYKRVQTLLDGKPRPYATCTQQSVTPKAGPSMSLMVCRLTLKIFGKREISLRTKWHLWQTSVLTASPSLEQR